MSRATALKHLKVADFWNRNVSLRKHFAGLSLSKIYALARTKQIVARRLTTDETVRSMTDARFAKFIRVYLPKNHQPPSASNLFRSIMAGLQRAGCGISRWKGSGCAISGEYLRRIETRLKFLLAATLRGSQSRQRAL
jgi:hypothetical protein